MYTNTNSPFAGIFYVQICSKEKSTLLLSSQLCLPSPPPLPITAVAPASILPLPCCHDRLERSLCDPQRRLHVCLRVRAADKHGVEGMEDHSAGRRRAAEGQDAAPLRQRGTPLRTEVKERHLWRPRLRKIFTQPRRRCLLREAPPQQHAARLRRPCRLRRQRDGGERCGKGDGVRPETPRRNDPLGTAAPPLRAQHGREGRPVGDAFAEAGDVWVDAVPVPRVRPRPPRVDAKGRADLEN